jgi:phospholipid/cholesterol/gamma-HCH transport system substrate-binding protein
MKAKRWRSEFKVGLMTIIGLTMLFILLMKASDWHLGGGDREIRIHFENVGGLLEDAPVHMHGVKVGKVTRVELVENKVEVTASLDTEAPIREGYQIFIDILGLVGEKYIEITNGPAVNPPTKDDPLKGVNPISVGKVLMRTDEITNKTIKTIDFVQEFISKNEKDIHAGATELKNLISEARGILKKTMGNVDILLARVNRITEATEDDVSQAMADLSALASGFRKDREKISSLIDDTSENLDQLMKLTTPAIEESAGNIREVSQDLRDSIQKANEHLSELSKSTSQLVAQLNDFADSGNQKLQKGLDNFNNSVAELNEIAGRVNAIAADIESGKGTLGKLINDEAGYEQLYRTVAATKNIVEDVNEATASLDRKLEFFKTMRSSKQYELSYDSLSRSLQNRFTLSVSGLGPYVYMAGLSVRDVPTYDLQVGREFGDLMVRVGAIRSKSSIGLDYWILSRHLSASLEVIDVTDREPTVDMDLAFRFFDSWYFIFGARDLARSKRGFNIGFRAVAGE